MGKVENVKFVVFFDFFECIVKVFNVDFEEFFVKC